MKDVDDRMVQLLEQIAKNTGSLDQPDKNITLKGQTADSRVGLLPAQSYITVETSDLDDANADGTITLHPGETKALVKHTRQPKAVYAVGASDASDVEYGLLADKQPVGGTTNSPLGLINDPFSFVDQLGGAVPCNNRAEYKAHLDSSATGPVDLAARMHLEVMG